MKRITGITLAAALLLSQAHAQRTAATWRVVECYHTEKDGVLCTMTYTPGSDVSGEYWRPTNFAVASSTGATVNGSWIKIADGEWNEYWSQPTDYFGGVPVSVHVLFKVPQSMTVFRAMSVNGTRFANVPIRGAIGAPAAPAPIKLPNTQAVIGGKAYTISFTSCKPAASGAYACSSTVTPNR
ncbi:hypothetical protein GCM10008956_30340 [Deinococcus arenae]|uniref:Uncharacterized protein n=1 Tax=Deinococcus arenae TaxID=1452751 RepID=A0A8H9GRJ2_9DEIO|nr:hypothetical protein [Deinococcus arenae]GGM52187.1 hypothetical protein GCM10008956_30340 [Deinococcus arenae]